MRLVRHVRLRARRALEVVELHDEDLRALGRDVERNPRLGIEPALELAGLLGRRGRRRRPIPGRRRQRGLPREQRHRRARARHDQHGQGQGQGTRQQPAGVAHRAARHARHRHGGRRPRQQEQPDHGGVGGQAERADRVEQEERDVAEVQNPGQRQRREGEQVRRHALADFLGPAQAGPRQEPGHGEPGGPEQRHGHATHRAEPAHVDLRAVDGGVHVADAHIARIDQQPVVHVRRRQRGAQPDQGAEEQEPSRRPIHEAKNSTSGMPAARHPARCRRRRRNAY